MFFRPSRLGASGWVVQSRGRRVRGGTSAGSATRRVSCRWRREPRRWERRRFGPSGLGGGGSSSARNWERLERRRRDAALAAFLRAFFGSRSFGRRRPTRRSHARRWRSSASSRRCRGPGCPRVRITVGGQEADRGDAEVRLRAGRWFAVDVDGNDSGELGHVADAVEVAVDLAHLPHQLRFHLLRVGLDLTLSRGLPARRVA